MSEIDRLNTLFHYYSPVDLVEARKNTDAFANEVFDVTTSDGERYFLKILKEQLATSITNEVMMQKRLAAAGISSPQYLEISDGKYVGEHKDERFVLSKRIAGTSPTHISDQLIRSFGVTLARLHDCLDGVEVPASDMQWLNLRKVEADLSGYDGPMKDDLQAMVDYGKTIFDLGLPQAVIHGDLWMGNVFAVNDEITAVFDLETAERTVRILDLARTYTSLRFNSNYTLREVTEGLIAGYDSVAKIPISNIEKNNLNSAIAFVSGACAIWHAINGTRYAEPYAKLGREIVDHK